MGRGVVLSALSLLAAREVFAGSAEAAPSVHRPEWVIWTVLGSMLLVLFFILIATQGGWRGKRGGKIEPPYF